MSAHPPRPRYRFCWECSRQLHGNAHRVVRVEGHDAIVHAACAEEMERDGRLEGPIQTPEVKP